MQQYPWTPLRFISFGKSWLPNLAADASAAKQNSPSSTASECTDKAHEGDSVSEKRCSRRLKCRLHSYGYLLSDHVRLVSLNVSDSFTYRKKSHFTKKITLTLLLFIKYSLEENDKGIKLPITLLLKLPMAFGHCSSMCFGLKK